MFFMIVTVFRVREDLVLVVFFLLIFRGVIGAILIVNAVFILAIHIFHIWCNFIPFSLLFG